jgi:hypothetical protein
MQSVARGTPVERRDSPVERKVYPETIFLFLPQTPSFPKVDNSNTTLAPQIQPSLVDPVSKGFQMLSTLT